MGKKMGRWVTALLPKRDVTIRWHEANKKSFGFPSPVDDRKRQLHGVLNWVCQTYSIHGPLVTHGNVKDPQSGCHQNLMIRSWRIGKEHGGDISSNPFSVEFGFRPECAFVLRSPCGQQSKQRAPISWQRTRTFLASQLPSPPPHTHTSWRCPEAKLPNMQSYAYVYLALKKRFRVCDFLINEKNIKPPKMVTILLSRIFPPY